MTFLLIVKLYLKCFVRMGKCEKEMAFSEFILNTINLGRWLCDRFTGEKSD